MNLLRRLRTSATIALILSPTGLLLIAVIRLLIISNYNPVTASTIVSSGGYVNTLLGTVIPLVPIFMPYIALVLLFFRRIIPGILAFVTMLLISPTEVSRAAALKLLRSDCGSVYRWSIAHWPIVMPLTAAAVILLVFTLIGLGLTMFIRIVGTIASLALIPTIVFLYPLPYQNNFYSQQLRQLWLPAKTITLTSGREVTGYVLSSDSDWLVVLREDTRRVIYYHASRVVMQRVCQIGQMGQAQVLRPLVTLTSDVTVVRPCPEGGPEKRPVRRAPQGGCPVPSTPIPPQVRPTSPGVYRNIPRCT